MKEKRISLRFREENEQDMKAWAILEKTSKEKNISKNAALLDFILANSEKADSADELAERIALLVVDKLQEDAIYLPMGSGASGNSISEKKETIKNTDINYQADEPEVLGEEALDFLEMFG